MIAEGSVQVLWTFYFMWVSQNAMTFMYFCCALNLITGLLCLMVTESPRWLYCTQQYEKLKVAMEKIARWNGVTDYECPDFEVIYNELVEQPMGFDKPMNGTSEELAEKEREAVEGGHDFSKLMLSERSIDGGNGSHHLKVSSVEGAGKMRDADGKTIVGRDGKTYTSQPMSIDRKTAVAVMNDEFLNLRD